MGNRAKAVSLILAALLVCGSIVSCDDKNKDTAVTDGSSVTTDTLTAEKSDKEEYTGTRINLSDDGITVDGKAASTDNTQAVYVANDIVYYESGKDFTYGEGTADDAHTAAEAESHTVVHITKAGQYVLNGKLSAGQVAVDLGDDAEDDPTAVVTLVLDGVDITNTVAPGVIFYNVYECGSADTETAAAVVDTAKAGANVIIADGSENTVNGSYVARIYKPGTVELSEDGTEVADAKKLHKYDAAFYSKKSMNINGGTKGDGILNINAENEGLDSELHLTVNGGNINIVSGNDGINTNEDYVSVTTVNGGNLRITVDGKTGEGDGIDSNGWLVINGGSVIAQACADSGDAGIDSDMGIHINGGTVFATGNMLDRISDSTQNYAVFTFALSQTGGVYSLKNSDGNAVVSEEVNNRFSYLIISHKDLTAGEYTLWQGETKLQGSASGNQGMGGMGRPFGDGGMVMPEGEMTMPEGMERPQGGKFEEGQMTMPEGMENPEDFRRPIDGTFAEGQPPEGIEPMGNTDGNATENSAMFVIADGGNYFTVGGFSGETSTGFIINDGGNYFSGIMPAEM